MQNSARSFAGICLIAASLFFTWSSAFANDVTFERDIRPILRAHCFDCHGATEEPKGGLDLRQVRRMLQGGESGTAIVPANVDASLLLQRVRAGEMPPGKTKLTPKEINTLTLWIAGGVKIARRA